MKLVDKRTKETIALPCERESFRGVRWTILSISQPSGGGSSGKVVAVQGERRQEFYPSVFNAEIDMEGVGDA